MMQAKIVQNNVTNSPDSSEESSGGSPNHFTGGIDGPNIEAEECLPSVMISINEKRMEFLCQLCGLGASIQEDRLREGARILLAVLPRCRNTEKSLREAFILSSPTGSIMEKKPSYNLLFNTDPAVVLYRLEVLYTMLFPSVNPGSPAALELLMNFFTSGGALMVVEMLTKNNFMPLADTSTKRSAYLAVLKLTKAVLTVTSLLVLKVENELMSHIDRVRVLSEGMKHIPNPHTEAMLKLLAEHVAKSLHLHLKSTGGDIQSPLRLMVNAAMSGTLPDGDTIRLLIRLASATASGSLAYFSNDSHQANREPFDEDILGRSDLHFLKTSSF